MRVVGGFRLYHGMQQFCVDAADVGGMLNLLGKRQPAEGLAACGALFDLGQLEQLRLMKPIGRYIRQLQPIVGVVAMRQRRPRKQQKNRCSQPHD
jgi:hypothetical protein